MFQSPDEVEKRIGRERFLQIFDHGMKNAPDEEILSTAITDANRLIQAKLRKKGYSDEQIEILAQDDLLRRQAAFIVAEYGSLCKPELISSDGSTFYTALSDKALKVIQDIADSILRPQKETVAGPPVSMQGMSMPLEPEFHMAPGPDRPSGRGGF